MKGLIRIGGAAAVGVIIILGALYVRSSAPADMSGKVVVAPAPERTYIESHDSDGDGIKDWEENLQARVFDSVNVPTSTISLNPDEEYVPPTTFTGKFSEAFFKDYLQGKIDGEDFSDPSAFVGSAVQAIEKNTQSKRHTRLELNIIPSSEEAIRAYGNRIPEIIATYSIKNENEMLILQRALEANNPNMLKDLAAIKEVYIHTIADTIAMDVPESLATAHIDLLNAYEAILFNIEAMQVAFTDPLYSLARVKGYPNDADALFNAFKNIANVLTQNNIIYANEERGAFFYLFDI